MLLTRRVFFYYFLFSVFWGYHKQGSCQAGMSAAITKVSIKFLLFNISWEWNGTTNAQNQMWNWYATHTIYQFHRDSHNVHSTISNPSASFDLRLDRCSIDIAEICRSASITKCVHFARVCILRTHEMCAVIIIASIEYTSRCAQNSSVPATASVLYDSPYSKLLLCQTQ